MKKTSILLAFIAFSLVGFSQTANTNNNGNGIIVKKQTLPLGSDASKYRAVRIGEKIQITEEGVVKHQKVYAPQYPTPMIDPEKQPVKINLQPQNN